MDKKYRTFAAFYPYYLAEHANPTCRVLHFIGTSLVISAFVTALLTRNPLWFAAMPLAGYGFAWVGHFFFERNRPATFTYPLYSFAADFVMFGQLLVGKIPFRIAAR